MATMILSTAGAAFGAALGGPLLGGIGGIIGQGLGGLLGGYIDDALGISQDPISLGQQQALRLGSAGDGGALPIVFGRARIGGQVIWVSDIIEKVSETDPDGKGSGPAYRNYSYSCSLAVAFGEGPILAVDTIWIDGNRFALSDFEHRLYLGTDTQEPDPAIIASLGANKTPAYRKTAYIVFENFDLTKFGNRLPLISAEIQRVPDSEGQAHDLISAVAMIPGSGEYVYETSPVKYSKGLSRIQSVNVNQVEGEADFNISMTQLQRELPNVGAVSLVVSWFGSDLRCGVCDIRPRVEHHEGDPNEEWAVAGMGRDDAVPVSLINGAPAYGGTPTDHSVLSAIQKLTSDGKSVMYYPFIMMDIPSSNSLVDPWSGGVGQAAYPWRGRITFDHRYMGETDTVWPETPDECVARFFGTAKASDFSISGQSYDYTGAEEWSYRRFILSQAVLCKIAGGVSAFCIGSEMRGLTEIRGVSGDFPAVEALKALAHEVRMILEPQVKIGYAADWSEYSCYRPQDGSNDLWYHLDPLWMDEQIDFIGIDNYMPLSDWRETGENCDEAQSASVYDLNYLKENIEGGEGYDWYYGAVPARAYQRRTPISDSAYGEDWVFRYKDIRNWWSQYHYHRPQGVKANEVTEWEPMAKPIWFTEIGCPAVHLGTNQPNVFYDPKSSESALPHYSEGYPDPLIQRQYLKALYEYWNEPEHNPQSPLYEGAMIDTARIFTWTWDARPWPAFPQRSTVWSDAANYRLGHWLNGRIALADLGAVVSEICRRQGVTKFDCSKLYGSVEGFVFGAGQTGREALAMLMLVYDFTCHEHEGELVFIHPDKQAKAKISREDFVYSEKTPVVALKRNGGEEAIGALMLGYIDPQNDYQLNHCQYVIGNAPKTSKMSVPLIMSSAEAFTLAKQLYQKHFKPRVSVDIGLPPSLKMLKVGDVVDIELAGGFKSMSIERIHDKLARHVSLSERVYYGPQRREFQSVASLNEVGTGALYSKILSIPYLPNRANETGDYLLYAHGEKRGAISLAMNGPDGEITAIEMIAKPAIIGSLQTELQSAYAGRWARPHRLIVTLDHGHMASLPEESILAGANIIALNAPGEQECELIQFSSAELIGERSYRLDTVLRGQFGTEHMIKPVWPIGTEVTLVTDALIELPKQDMPVERDIIIQTPNHADAKTLKYFPSAIAERPLNPVHLESNSVENGRYFYWIRRTRRGQDNWTGLDVALAEAEECYHCRIKEGDNIVHEAITKTPAYTYLDTDRSAHGLDHYVFEVAQISQSYGVGLYASIEI